MRPPRPEKTIEYSMTVHRRTDEESGAVHTVFEVRTTREFQSYQYLLKLEASLHPEAREIHFAIGGVAVPPDLMPGEGPAVGSFVTDALLPGTYTVRIKKAPKDVNVFALKLTKAAATLEEMEIIGRKFISLVR